MASLCLSPGECKALVCNGKNECRARGVARINRLALIKQTVESNQRRIALLSTIVGADVVAVGDRCSDGSELVRLLSLALLRI
jgi:hypothetical protein